MDLKNLPIIDWPLSIKLAGKKETADELLTLLLENLPKEFAAIRHAYEEKNFSSLLQLVHKLHGALCYCGLLRLKDAICEIEDCLNGESTKTLEDLPLLMRDLNIEVQLVTHCDLFDMERM